MRLPKKDSKSDPRIYSCNWPGPCFKDHALADLRAEAQNHLVAPPVLPPSKLLPFQLWRDNQDMSPSPPTCKWTGDVIPTPDSSTPSNLVVGALQLGQRRAYSACLQVFFKHRFSGEYSTRFRQGTGDTVWCPCDGVGSTDYGDLGTHGNCPLGERRATATRRSRPRFPYHVPGPLHAWLSLPNPPPPLMALSVKRSTRVTGPRPPTTNLTI